jgi:peptidoglycan lytic transglycosylase D
MHHNNKPSRRTRPIVRSFTVPAIATLVAACQSASLERSDPPSPAAVPPLVVSSAELVPIPMPSVERREPILERYLLTRLRAGFRLAPSDDPAVVRERSWYARNQQYLDRVFRRADLYLFHIVAELEKRDLPAELALLPVVESAFDPFAYSHGRASGLWQIIPGTGKRLGLQQNWWFDGRRDVLESTRAALDYLEHLHAEFDGDWLLAVAGYNSGEGNVHRAVKRAQAAGKPTDFWGIKSYLPAETRTYVPRLLAVSALVANPDEHGISLPELMNEPRFAVVETGSQIDMTLAAELAGLDTDSLYALNPGVNRWATDPEGPHRLLLPVGQAAQFTASLAALGERERVQWTRHRVKQGETIGEIATKYDTTAAVLREINELRGTTIRAGDYLMVPHALHSLASYTQSAPMRAERQQSTPQNGIRREHVVRAGESLWSISRVYGVDVRRLASWNSMAPGDVLSVGRDLVVWTRDPAAAAPRAAASEAAGNPKVQAVAATQTVPTFEAQERLRQITYVVRRGDSLSSIAQRFRVTVPNLLEWNDVATDRYLQPGQRLVMFVNVTEQSG